MQVGLTTSFIIGGMLLVSFLTLNKSVVENATTGTMDRITKDRTTTIAEIVTFDFDKIGFADPETMKSASFDPIVSFDSTEITFKSNIDNSSDNTVETISWVFTATPASETANPNDFILTRTVTPASGTSFTVEMIVTNFNLKFYNGQGVETSDPNQIKLIDVTLEAESPQKMGNRSDYSFSSWSKRFTPYNLSVN